MIKALIGGLAAATLVSAPLVHAATPARAASPIENFSAMGGENSLAPWIMALVIVGGIIWAISETDDERPDSP